MVITIVQSQQEIRARVYRKHSHSRKFLFATGVGPECLSKALAIWHVVARLEYQSRTRDSILSGSRKSADVVRGYYQIQDARDAPYLICTILSYFCQPWKPPLCLWCLCTAAHNAAFVNNHPRSPSPPLGALLHAHHR